ncbi:hypothetical protein CQ14_37685 [Bradyrhizobium lablabi]|uniref:Uncharacterized protein n=1 Tax=Bradyrhizobium lablabi TaxID=722472 RepID=A0A0R3MD35_9BRAD|nr:hypothetical protein CQ14_37685 [Bradyrhizobium lablabi]
MTRQDVGLAYSFIGEETIGRLGIRPVLANHRNALADVSTNLLQQHAKSLAKPSVLEFAQRSFTVKPGHRVRRRPMRLLIPGA